MAIESMEAILKHYRFTPMDQRNREELGTVLLPRSEQLAEDFYSFLLENPYTAAFFTTEEAMMKRKQTIKKWFEELFTAKYDHRYLMRLKRIGQVHVRIGLEGHHVNSSMNLVRIFCLRQIDSEISDSEQRQGLIETLDKIIDINLDVMTSSYREAEIKKVFVSHRLEFWLVRWSERLLHGLNLLLMVGLLVLSAGVVGLLASDILYALQETLETGVIKALGSLLILWMMIELLHTQVENLRGGRRYPRAGYGGTFFHWLHSSDPRPYNPFILKYPPGPPPESTDPSPVAGP
ncbi:MAG: heme-binding sensor globin domain-containing protein [Deltaproteobacteria bacterium]|nr:heme-binding sensor globin domain-containing protein [Deltaproteobacteria bacterium]